VIRCAVGSGLVGEPLAGTAPVARRWLVVEHREAWGRDVNTDAGPAITALAERAKAADARLTLIRAAGRRRAQAGRDRRVFLADTTPGRCRLTTMSATLDELLELDLGPGGELPGEELAEPVLLVCAHTRRDRCCAIDGRALAGRLVTQIQVWECSHLGGHRFAPTAVVLPTGYVYGRLDAPGALALVKAAAAGEVDPGSCRGRSTWQPAGQVAELAVRERTGERHADALTVDGTDGDQVTVRHVDGRRWRVTVEQRPLDGLRPSSCGGPEQAVSALRVREWS